MNMNRKTVVRFGLPLAIALLSLAVAHAVGGDTKVKETEVTLEQVPAAVRATILHEAGDHKVLEIEQVQDGEQLYFEADWIEDGMEVEIQVAADGKLLGREVETPDDDGDDDDDEDRNEDDDD